MKNQSSNILLMVVIGVVAGAIAASLVVDYKLEQEPSKELQEPTREQLIKEFYSVETAVSVSPHHIRKHLADDDSFILVDLRSQEEYEEEHIIGAVNIPAYKDRDHSDYGAVDRIVSSFKELQAENPDKEFIVYCYSMPCMTGRKVGQILAEEDIYVKHLGVGWNEWRYFWTLWNHPHEWNTTNVEDYVTSGPEPGTFEGDLTGSSCPIGGELGC